MSSAPSDPSLDKLLRELDAADVERARMRQPYAWRRLRDRLQDAEHRTDTESSRMPVGWRWVSLGLVGLLVAALVVSRLVDDPAGGARIASASAFQPQVQVTAFYAPAADADVVWLTGLPSLPGNGPLGGNNGS